MSLRFRIVIRQGEVKAMQMKPVMMRRPQSLAACVAAPHRSLSTFTGRTAAVLTSSSASTSSSSLPSPLSVMLQQRRHRGFHFYLNLDDPAETRRRVEEDLARIDQEQQRGTMVHLHALLNLALSYYQSGDYVTARDYAVYTHEKARQRNRNATLLFFTAKTCARCSRAVADEYEAYLREVAEQTAVSSTLAPRPSVVFAAERAIAKLREEAVRYDGIARRLCNRPDKAFMRAGEAAAAT
ncbi:hypothetical protein DQ04_18801010, partial [Trypanosoma grayi]|uniref:hypothetical protein n=1 Tax=Trypanosoma grayi TaxID=71804 RepID=UPI0004F4B154